MAMVGILNLAPAGGVAGAGLVAAPSCAADKRVVASCFAVHGRLRLYANMRLYLWPQGSSHLLGIADHSDLPGAGYFMPKAVAQLLGPKTDVWGDFRVCPFTPSVQGHLQEVCIESARHLRPRPQPSR